MVSFPKHLSSLPVFSLTRLALYFSFWILSVSVSYSWIDMTSGAWTPLRSEEHEFVHGFSGVNFARSFVFCGVFCSLCWLYFFTSAKEKDQKDKQRSAKCNTQNLRSSNTNPTKNWGELMCLRRVSSSCSTWYTCRVTLLHTRWKVMNEERTRLWLRQIEHIRGYLWDRYSLTENQVMVVTVKLSKWWLQFNH
jgi:hypothetical protein